MEMMISSYGSCLDELSSLQRCVHPIPLLLALPRTNVATIIASMRRQAMQIDSQVGLESSANTEPGHETNWADLHAHANVAGLETEPSVSGTAHTPADSGASRPKRSSAVRGGQIGKESEGSANAEESARATRLRKQRESSKRSWDKKNETIKRRKEGKAALDETIAALTAEDVDLVRQLKEQEQEESVKEQILLRIEQRIEEEKDRLEIARQARDRAP